MVKINFKFLATLAASTAVAAFGTVIPKAEAVITESEVIECFGANAPAVCLNGQGASFAFRFAVQAFGDPNNAQVFAPPGGNLFNNFNYASRGSSSGRRSFLAVRSEGDAVFRPYAFSFSDSALSSSDLAAYNSTSPVNIGGSIGTIPRGPAARGFGQPVQLPIIGGSITVAYDNTSVANNVNLTTQQVCGLFNGTPSQTNPPAGLVNAQGVYRTDGSGTTDIFSSVLRAKCTPLGLWQTPAGTSRGSGSESTRDTDPRCAFEPGQGTRPSNLVCWPGSFANGPQNEGVAEAIRTGGVPRFGYVEFATATAPDNEGILEIALVDGQSPDPATGNPAAALNSAQATSNGQCILTVDPTTSTSGYIFTGVSYLLAYGDYAPVGADRITYNGRGDQVRDQLRSLITGAAVSNAPLRSALQQAGYTPLSNAPGSLGRNVAGRALQCINAVQN